MAYAVRLCPKWVPCVMLQVYERPEISRVEVYGRVGKCVVWVSKMFLTHIPHD